MAASKRNGRQYSLSRFCWLSKIAFLWVKRFASLPDAAESRQFFYIPKEKIWKDQEDSSDFPFRKVVNYVLTARMGLIFIVKVMSAFWASPHIWKELSINMKDPSLGRSYGLFCLLIRTQPTGGALPPPPPPHDYFLLPKNIAQTIAAGLSAALPISSPTTNRLVG